MSDVTVEGKRRGRVAMTFDEKIDKLVSGDMTAAQKAFFDWASSLFDEKLDALSFLAGSQLYTEYTNTEEFKSASEARKAEREKAAETKLVNQLSKLEELAKKLGKTITIAEAESDDSDDDDTDLED